MYTDLFLFLLKKDVRTAEPTFRLRQQQQLPTHSRLALCIHARPPAEQLEPAVSEGAVLEPCESEGE